jgi:hypothetical protein
LSKKRDDNRSSKEIAQEKKERAAADGRVAMAEIAARAAFVEKNTARLRELRLAKEAAEREAETNAPPKPAKGAKATKAEGAMSVSAPQAKTKKPRQRAGEAS